MIEIVFGDSAAGSLKEAQRFGVGEYPGCFIGTLRSVNASAEFEFQKKMPNHTEFTVSTGKQQYSVDDPAVIMSITNNTGGEASFGVEYSLEQLTDGEWQAVRPNQPLSFNAIAVVLPAEETHKFHINLDDYGLNLETGRYRLVKQLGLWYYAAEFELI